MHVIQINGTYNIPQVEHILPGYLFSPPFNILIIILPPKDVFNLRYIVCPINLDNMHWTSAVIFMELKKIQYFDSMGGTDRSKLEGLLQYLKDEHKAKKGTELDVSEWELVPCTMDTPRQRNGKFWGCLCMTFYC